MDITLEQLTLPNISMLLAGYKYLFSKRFIKDEERQDNRLPYVGCGKIIFQFISALGEPSDKFVQFGKQMFEGESLLELEFFAVQKPLETLLAATCYCLSEALKERTAERTAELSKFMEAVVRFAKKYEAGSVGEISAEFCEMSVSMELRRH